MVEKLALCIEDFGETQEASRFTSCVALPRGEPGLGLDAQGRPSWADASRSSLWIFVQEDGRLAVRMAAGAPGAILRRAGREIPVPASAPGATGEAVLLDNDVLLYGGRTLKITVHGKTPGVHPPRPLRGDTDAERPPLGPPPMPVVPFPPAVMPPCDLEKAELSRKIAREALVEVAKANREALEEGRRRGDIRQRLGEEIDEARRKWFAAISGVAALVNPGDFDAALVEVLAKGDRTLLGPA